MVFLKPFLLFVTGVLVGIAGFFWMMLGGIAPPASQEITRIDVPCSTLTPEDQWLQKVHFQIIPLDGVKSLNGYAIFLMTPPPGGVHPPPDTATDLYLSSSMASRNRDETEIQPILIDATDFGPNGDQPVLKFIDEECRTDRSSYYHHGQQLLIGSH